MVGAVDGAIVIISAWTPTTATRGQYRNSNGRPTRCFLQALGRPPLPTYDCDTYDCDTYDCDTYGCGTQDAGTQIRFMSQYLSNAGGPPGTKVPTADELGRPEKRREQREPQAFRRFSQDSVPSAPQPVDCQPVTTRTNTAKVMMCTPVQ